METPVSCLNDLLRPLTAILVAASVAGAPLAVLAQQTDQPPKRQNQQQQKPPAKPRTTTTPAKPTAPSAAAKTEALPPSQVGIGTLSKQAFMVDPQTSTVLLFKDADKPMHPSSMAKMMTIYIAFEEIEAGRLKLDTRFRVSERARNMGGSRMFVELGSEVTVEDLIKGMIVLSGNDACVVIAEGMSGNEDSFAERMTAKARELGMTGTLLKTVPGTDGLKTGHTEEGGYGQATSAIRDGRRLILVVNGMTSMAERAQETARLVEWGFRESTNTTVFRAGDTVVEAPVWLGSLDKVPLVVAKPVQITAPSGQTVTPRVVARFDGPIAAPITKGAKLGTAVVTLPDNRVVEYPLEAGADVPRMGVFGRVSTLIQHYLFGWLS